MNKFLVIGLGSMGKRRIRCLQALGVSHENIIGFDKREDRKKEARDKYNVLTVDALEQVDIEDIRAVIVSLPPDKHFLGAEYAIRNHKPVFIEASVVLEDALKIKELNCGQVLLAPSNTFTHHPILKKVIEVVKSGKYGKVTNFSYHRGDFLPEWHPWEGVEDFYVSNRITGGAREIVPFEMTWMVEAFGMPKSIKGYFRKTGEVGCDIEDCYVATLDYGNMLGTLNVNVSSRYVVQDLIINMQEGQIRWRWDEGKLCIYEANRKEWRYYEPNKLKHEDGYADYINEDMYIEELSEFIQEIDNPGIYKNTIEKDIEILRMLTELEETDGGFERGK